MKHATHCKFCKLPITVEIDDAYAELGDPLNLMKLAACNRCADLRVRRRYLEEEIQRAVAPLRCATPKQAEKLSEQIKARLIPLTKHYTAMIADWVKSTTPWWDMEIVESMIDKPRHAILFLKQCWKMYEPRQQTLKEKEEAYPYQSV